MAYAVALAMPDDDVGPVIRDVVLGNLVYAVPVAALLWRAAVCRPGRPWVWALAAAMGAWLAGNLILVLRAPPLGTDPAPFWAGVGYLAFYPLCILAVALSTRSRLGQLRRSVLLDGLAAGLAAAAVTTLGVLPLLASFSGGDLQIVAAVGPLVGDVAAMAMIVGLLAVTGGRADQHYYVLALGLVIFVGGDASYAIRFAAGSYAPGSPFDILWPLGLTIMAAGAWRPPPVAGPRPSVGMSSLWAVGACSLAALSVLVAASRLALPGVVVTLATASLLTAAVRVVIAFGQVRDLAAVRLQALTDELTGLPNRRRFVTRMTELLDAPGGGADDAAPGREADHHQHGLLLLDLDGFKAVNDSLGHAQGDLLLQRVANRLAAAVRSHDLVARLGGDEFAVVVAEAGGARQLERVAAHLLAEVARPVRLDRLHAEVSGSIGVVPFDASSGGTCEQLLGNADLAMYEAKRRGRNQAVTFDAGLRRRAEAQLLVQSDLRDALDRGGLQMWYQPVVDLRDGSWVGAESLCRWWHPTRGQVPPSEFIPLAEDVGLIGRIGERTRALALPQIAAWKQLLDVDHDFCVGLNVSGRELDDPDLVDRLLSTCRAAGITTDTLVLEVTESTLMGRGAAALDRLAELRSAGMSIAIDDFGTGYSSLAYLAALPADILKLDRSFVAALGGDRRTESVVRASVTLAQDLDMVLLAEGIETAEQHQRLLDLGCHLGQGFGLQRPVPAEEFTARLRATLAPVAGRTAGAAA